MYLYICVHLSVGLSVCPSVLIYICKSHSTYFWEVPAPPLQTLRSFEFQAHQKHDPYSLAFSRQSQSLLNMTVPGRTAGAADILLPAPDMVNEHKAGQNLRCLGIYVLYRGTRDRLSVRLSVSRSVFLSVCLPLVCMHTCAYIIYEEGATV